MEPIEISLPPQAKLLFNHLYPTDDTLFLTSDVLSVALPNNLAIDVSWYPEGEPSGAYTITVYRRPWDEANFEYQVETQSIAHVVMVVQELASYYCNPIVSGTNTVIYIGTSTGNYVSTGTRGQWYGSSLRPRLEAPQIQSEGESALVEPRS